MTGLAAGQLRSLLEGQVNKSTIYLPLSEEVELTADDSTFPPRGEA